jgi:flagellar biosynthesis GTPase FlhF
VPLDLKGRVRREDGLRGVLARLLGSRFRRAEVLRAAPARALDPVAATELATELSTRGASQAWASQLISTAGAHGPLAGSLRAAAEAEVARRIVPAPVLPATGAAVAFIGAGGSGKTRCVAALASAYRRGSTLGVSVLVLDNPDGARELRRLLADDDVPVVSLSGERAANAVSQARNDGFVVVDTPTATPTDPAQMEALSAQLEPLELDATYVALPATLGPEAARRALASFGRLRPSAVAITHVDETEQLAVAMEIAIAHRIPLAYLHSGTDHRTALSVVDATAIAQQLLTS